VVIPLQKKSDTFSAFKKFKAYAENLLDCKIKRFRDDKGGEYMSKEMCDFMDAAGIVRGHTVRNCPQQNGVAEKRNHTLNDDQTAMLAEANLPPSFWECLAALVHRIPTASVKNATPYEL
jgi:transposase InsO family protein